MRTAVLAAALLMLSVPATARAQALVEPSTRVVEAAMRVPDHADRPIASSAARALAVELAQTPPAKERKDSVGNGIAIGAAVGAATMFTVISVLYAQCDEGCDAPAFSELGVPVTAFGAGVGAVVGWLIDRAR